MPQPVRPALRQGPVVAPERRTVVAAPRVSTMAALAVVSATLTVSLARADAWLDAGDTTLRHHVQLLVDTNVIDIPLTAWPIPSTDLDAALSKITNRDQLTPAQRSAVVHLERAVGRLRQDATRLTVHVSGGRPVHVRTFENTPREEGEIGGSVSLAGSNASARLSVAAVVDPADGKKLRLDGSYGSVRLGNWLLTAGMLDRWWGPGWEGSMILSSNARPVPSISIERESSRAFESPWLSWIGPWRLSTFMGQMESEREDRDEPLLFGMRVSFRPFSEVSIGSVRPFDGLEFALERTAQWCAEGLPCNGRTFIDLFAGRDSLGDTASLEEEPGNQLAGWSLRWSSPFASFPFAIYRQRTAESIHLSEYSLGQSLTLLGVETWGGTSAGATWRAHAEFAASACGEISSAPLFDCAYINHLFPIEGYRYRGRTLGHAMDADGRMWSVGGVVHTANRWDIQLLGRYAEINRGGTAPDPRHTVSPVPIEMWNIEATLGTRTHRGSWRIGIGADQTTDVLTGREEGALRGFAEWRLDF